MPNPKQQEVLSPKSSESNSFSGTHYRKRANRKDVKYKTLLRRCRRFFQKAFDSETTYLTRRRFKGPGFFKEQVSKFAQEIMPEGWEPSLELEFYLASFLYPQHIMENIAPFLREGQDVEAYRTIAAKIHDILYNYTHIKLRAFTKMQELAFLFRVYYKRGAEKEKADKQLGECLENIYKECGGEAKLLRPIPAKGLIKVEPIRISLADLLRSL